MSLYHLFEIAVIALAVVGSLAFVFRRSGRRLIARLRGRPVKAASAGGCASCSDCGSCAPAPSPKESPIAILRR